ncbi:MAG: O-methyltransferase [Pseudomonadota bacterium]
MPGKTTLGLGEDLHAYLLANSLRESDAAKAARESVADQENARWHMAPEQGQFMALLAQIHGTRSYVEVGCFIGYGALWMAEAMPADSEIFTCEISEEFAEIARQNWRRAGVADRIDLRVTDAMSFLDGLLQERGANSTDMVFIDADKRPYPEYYARALELVRPGGLVLVDNVLWGGSVADPENTKESTEGIRTVTRTLHADERVDISMVPIADGVTIARKR